MLRSPYPFENRMTRTQTVLGWCYLPLHFLVLPLLFSLYALYAPSPIGEAQATLIYYLVGVAFCLLAMWSFLRTGYDVLAERLLFCVLTLLLAFCLSYGLSYFVTIAMMLGLGELVNPNNAEVMQLADEAFGMMKAVSIFLAPIVEETLFRGVVFGSLRSRSRTWAYVLSIVLFAVYHVWQYALAAGDWSCLIYALQYVPVAFALAWAYERSGSIWTSIFFHMGYNALSFTALQMLEQLS